MVDFVLGQDYNVFATAGIACYSEVCKKARNAALGQKMLFMDGHQLSICNVDDTF
jgi:hypothetical protein